MPGDLWWGKGSGRGKSELLVVEEMLNGASAEELEACARELLNGSPNLLETMAATLRPGKPASKELAEVAANWFGIGGPPMWLWDCTLSLGQMHEVMKETTARICLMMSAYQKQFGKRLPIDLWIQCGHNELRTILSWEDAEKADANPVLMNSTSQTLSGFPTKFTKDTTVLREWILVPFCDGYAADPPTVTASSGPEVLQAVADHSDKVDKATEARNRAITALREGQAPHLITPYDAVIDVIQDGFAENSMPYRDTPLAVPLDRDRRPQPAPADRLGIVTEYIKPMHEPPQSFLATQGQRPPAAPGSSRASWPELPDRSGVAGMWIRYVPRPLISNPVTLN